MVTVDVVTIRAVSFYIYPQTQRQTQRQVVDYLMTVGIHTSPDITVNREVFSHNLLGR